MINTMDKTSPNGLVLKWGHPQIAMFMGDDGKCKRCSFFLPFYRFLSCWWKIGKLLKTFSSVNKHEQTVICRLLRECFLEFMHFVDSGIDLLSQAALSDLWAKCPENFGRCVPTPLLGHHGTGRQTSLFGNCGFFAAKFVRKNHRLKDMLQGTNYFFTEVGPDFLIVHVSPIVLPCFTNAGQTCSPCLGSLCCIRSLPYLHPPLLQWWSTSWGLRKEVVGPRPLHIKTYKTIGCHMMSYTYTYIYISFKLSYIPMFHELIGDSPLPGNFSSMLIPCPAKNQLVVKTQQTRPKKYT
jgi:hypothetical protein